MSDPVPPSAAQDDGGSRLSRGPRWSSELHESLVSHEATASELRQELDDLRRTLDAAPGGRSARGRPSRRLVLGAVAATVLVLALGVVLAMRGAGSGAARGSSAATTPSGGSTTSPRVSLAPSATSTTGTTPAAPRRTARPVPAAAPLPPWPGETRPEPPGLPAHGVGADLPGTEVTAALGADRRSVEVYERALLAPVGTTLTLRPATSDQVARSLRAALPTITDLHAAIDGRPVPVTGTASGWTVQLSSTTTGSRLTLRYRLSGAVIRTEPAPRGRYNLVLTPLTPAADSGVGAGVVVRIRDPRVDEVYCPGTTDQLCGHKDGPLHVATVPGGAVPIVVGLVTFPT
jgi:hypothetical protein